MKKNIILFFIFFLVFSYKEDNNAQMIKKNGNMKLSKEEIQLRENEFNEFRKLLTQKLKKVQNFILIKEHLDENFYYAYKDETIIFYKNEDINLKNINNKINFNQVLAVLENGRAGIATKIAYLIYKKGSPAIDFVYSIGNNRWELKSIRYEKY